MILRYNDFINLLALCDNKRFNKYKIKRTLFVLKIFVIINMGIKIVKNGMKIKLSVFIPFFLHYMEQIKKGI